MTVVSPIAVLALRAWIIAPGTALVDDPPTVLKAIAGGFDENRAKFTRGTLRFDYIVGQAGDATTAHRGNLRDPSVAQGSYAFVNEGGSRKYAYRREFHEDDYAAKTTVISETQSSSPLDAFRAVTDGRRTLFDQVTWLPDQGLQHKAEIHPGEEMFFTHAEVPYEVGFPEDYRTDLAHDIRLALSAGGDRVIESFDLDVEDLGRRGLVRFRLKLPNGSATYLVDPERGWSLLHKRSEANGGVVVEYLYDDLRQVPGAGWLPFKKTSWLGGLVHQIVIREANCERPPGPEEFRLEFPKPRRMVDAAAKLVYREPQKVWDLFDLPSPGAQGVQPLRVAEPPSGGASHPSPLPGEREPTPWFLSIPGISILALLAAGLIGWSVYRRR